jgi:hypothetical protein
MRSNDSVKARGAGHDTPRWVHVPVSVRLGLRNIVDGFIDVLIPRRRFRFGTRRPEGWEDFVGFQPSEDRWHGEGFRVVFGKVLAVIIENISIVFRVWEESGNVGYSESWESFRFPLRTTTRPTCDSILAIHREE